MTDVAVNFDVEGALVEQGPPVNRVYPKHVYDVFEGDQIVLVGRYKKPGAAKVKVAGKIGTESLSFDFPANLVSHSGDQSLHFVEKLWATRRIGEIIDEIDLNGQNEELVKELVALSTRHGILTPYTAFLADENAPADRLSDLSLLNDQTRRNFYMLESELSGRAGVAQRFEKGRLQQAQIAGEAKGLFDGAAAGQGLGGAPGASRSLATGPGSAGANVRGAPGGPGGLGPAGPASATPPAQLGFKANLVRDAQTDTYRIAEAILNCGSETLYKRGKLWVANSCSMVDLAKDKSKIKEVARFSKEYFDLVLANNAQENQVLAAQQEDDELLVNLRGQIYHIK